MKELFRRLRYLKDRRQRDLELANDMEFHCEMAAREGGRPFGNRMRLREEARDAWGWTWIERFTQDVHYALRKLWLSPGFTLTALLMLAIGIGVNIAVFTFFDALALKSLPVRDADRILRFQRMGPHDFASDLPYAEMAFVPDHSKTLSAVLAENDSRLAVEGEERQLNAGFVTGNFFNEVGSAARLGRVLDPVRDDFPGAEPVVVIGFGFWRRHFGGDPTAVGRMIHLNGRATRVIGVASEKFTGLRSGGADLWVPITQQPLLVDGSRLLTDFSGTGEGVHMWGRLTPGLTARIAEDELRSLVAELRRSHPNDIWEKESLFSKPGAYATSPHGHNKGTHPSDESEVYPVVGLAGALSFLILAVACGNLGSLPLARGVARQREISIRAAVGAGRGRLVRQLFTESLVLALLGSAAGLAFGYGTVKCLVAFTDAPPWVTVTPDWRVVTYAIVMGFVSAVLFGLTPTLQIARQRQRATIVRQVLIGAQVAGSCILLIVAGLLVRALDRAVSAYPGFEYEQVISISPGLAGHGYAPEEARAFLDEFRNRLRSSPGVESVSMSSIPPLGGAVASTGITVNGRHVDFHTNRIDPEFFKTMTIPLLRGRTLRSGEANAIVIGQSLAHILWPGEDPVGKQFPADSDSLGASGNDTVVGVVGSARLVERENAEGVEAYYAATVTDLPSMSVLVKTSGPVEGVIPLLVSTARSIDARIFPEVQTLKNSFRRKLQGAQYGTVAVGLLGMVSLLLACFGIVGLVFYAVSQRTKEIGIRMALGAKPANILSIVLRQLSPPVAAGLAAGLAAAGAFSQLLRRQLYGVSSLDPIVYGAVLCSFAVVVTTAAVLPARRALLVNPLTALRYD